MSLTPDDFYSAVNKTLGDDDGTLTFEDVDRAFGVVAVHKAAQALAERGFVFSVNFHPGVMATHMGFIAGSMSDDPFVALHERAVLRGESDCDCRLL